MQLVNEARDAAKERTRFEIFLMQTFGKKIYLCHEGSEKHDGWRESIAFYLFWCIDCKHWAKNYPNGYPERQRLHCSNCNRRYSFVQLRTRLKMIHEFFKLIRRMRSLKKEHKSSL